MIEAVAFDLGGVLVDVSMERAAESFGITASQFRSRVFSRVGEEAHTAMSTGDGAVAFLLHVAAEFETAVDIAERAWASVVRPRPTAAALLSVLAQRPNLAVTAWSNTDSIHTRRLLPAFPALFTKTRVLSFEVGFQKPTPAFFAAGIARLNVAPEAILFVDDRGENVDAARSFGIDAHVVTSVSEVESVLRASLPDFHLSI